MPENRPSGGKALPLGILLVAAALLLSGCGFRLEGRVDLASNPLD